MQICKWTIPVDNSDHPIGTGKVLLVACQRGPETVEVWTEENADARQRNITRCRVYGTGEYVAPGDEHCGSVSATSNLAWHLYRKSIS